MKRLWFEWVGALVYMAVITRVAAEVVQATLDASGVDFAPELYSAPFALENREEQS